MLKILSYRTLINAIKNSLRRPCHYYNPLASKPQLSIFIQRQNSPVEGCFVVCYRILCLDFDNYRDSHPSFAKATEGKVRQEILITWNNPYLYTSIITGMTIGLRSVSRKRNSPISSRSLCLAKLQSGFDTCFSGFAKIFFISVRALWTSCSFSRI